MPNSQSLGTATLRRSVLMQQAVWWCKLSRLKVKDIGALPRRESLFMFRPAINPLPMQSRAAAILTVGLFLAGMVWFSRGLDFPPYYHPDEINKVDQLQQNTRNFNHPQLMLNSAAIVYWLAGSPSDNVRTAAVTRWVSVFFAALAVALLAHTAGLLAGLVAQITCGLLLSLRRSF